MAFATVYFYAILCAVCLWWAAHSPLRDRRDAVLCAIVLGAGCYLSNVAWWVNATPVWVSIDGPAMAYFLFRLWRDRRPWKVRLTILAVAIMGTHAFFGQVDDGWSLKSYVYPAALNALFCLQLFTVGRIGAKGVLNGSVWLVPSRLRRAGDYLSRVRRRPDQ